MMHDLGHQVYLYAGQYNDAPCTEHICCIKDEDRYLYLDGAHNTPSLITSNWDVNSKGWRIYNHTAIAEISKRIEPKDFICAIGGNCHKPVADAFPAHMTVEFGIGYTGTFSKYRVWESYAWLHLNYGAASGNNAYGVDGQWFEDVIPCYLPMESFPFEKVKEDYYLYIGRLIDRKGYSIAVEVCKTLGKKLILAGQGTPPEYGEYRGVVGPEERGKLLSKAQAVFMPTLYIEPGGNVAIEAQACGTPVICTDWGSMTETVVHGVTGYRCRMFDEFCEATDQVKALDPTVIRKHVEDNYSLPVTAKKYEKYFTKLLTLWNKGWYERNYNAA